MSNFTDISCVVYDVCVFSSSNVHHDYFCLQRNFINNLIEPLLINITTRLFGIHEKHLAN